MTILRTWQRIAHSASLSISDTWIMSAGLENWKPLSSTVLKFGDGFTVDDYKPNYYFKTAPVNYLQTPHPVQDYSELFNEISIEDDKDK